MRMSRMVIFGGSPARLVVLASVLAAACRSQAPQAPAAAAPAASPAPNRPVPVDVVTVVVRPLEAQLTLAGELAAFQSVDVHARANGFVKTVAVDRGTTVRQGQLLATLDAPELAAQRAEAQSKLQAAEAQLAVASARADADRGTYDRLNAASATPGVVAGNDLLVAGKAAEATRSQVTSAERGVDAARQALRAVQDLEAYLRLTAPFDGVVTERHVHPGALVGPSGAAAATALFRVVDARTLRLTVPVPEAYATAVAAGTEVPFSVAAYPGERMQGRVARVAQEVDTTTRTMAVELDVLNTDGRLAPGHFAQVRWPVRRSAPSRFVPSSSVASTTDRTFVIRIRDDKAEWIDVRTGLTSGPLVEVFGDLETGDSIAVRGTDELRPGAAVTARQANAANPR